MKGYYDYHAGSDPTPDEIMFDNLLAKALGSYLERQGRQLDDLCQEEGAPMPLEFQRKTTRRCQRRKAARRAASLFLAAAVGFFLMMGTVEAFRVKIFNTYFDISDEFTKWVINSQSIISHSIISNDIIMLEDLPAGFTVAHIETRGDITTIKYVNNNYFIYFIQQDIKDTECHQAVEENGEHTVLINGATGIISVVNKETTLLWRNESKLLKIFSNLSSDVIIKIAEGATIN